MHINCSYKLITLYGPLAIHSYGFFIALGILVSMYLMSRNKRFIQLNINNQLTDIICFSIIAGVFGGRIIEIITEPQLYPHISDWLALWKGGFSSLGSIIGVITIMPLYLWYKHIPIMPLFDVAALYAPLFQSIARLGCLFAGCCHGTITTSIFAIIYTHPDTIAQCGIPVHPTQLYSSAFLFCIFLFMYFFAQHRMRKPGTLFFCYLVLASSERFIIDFLRADRITINHSWLSYHQFLALITGFSGLLLYFYRTFFDSKQ